MGKVLLEVELVTFSSLRSAILTSLCLFVLDVDRRGDVILDSTRTYSQLRLLAGRAHQFVRPTHVKISNGNRSQNKSGWVILFYYFLVVVFIIVGPTNFLIQFSSGAHFIRIRYNNTTSSFNLCIV